MQSELPAAEADLCAAATDLAALLERENQLLAALDLRGAATLLPEKRRVADAFTAAQARTTRPPPDGAAIGARLRQLAAENRRLLERGLAAQGRVIAVIARAARKQAATTPRYGATGATATTRTTRPLAISARV